MKWLKDKLQLVACVAVIGGFLLLVGGCVRWQFEECTSVGHSALYCVWQMGSRR
ncbi:hypothetical protein [Stenotrophomonas maltophilia]|uniref:hypothetical protein n=1 Tax=Stenotrophomonas maltophilia TaxID=40324 RepID=UPI0016601AA9|nr:hypothetical protein [Stenotrophomonas maltophilia]